MINSKHNNVFIRTSKDQLEIVSDTPQSSRMKKVHDQVDSVYVNNFILNYINIIYIFIYIQASIANLNGPKKSARKDKEDFDPSKIHFNSSITLSMVSLD